VLLVVSLTRVNGTITVVQTFTFFMISYSLTDEAITGSVVDHDDIMRD